MVRLQTARILSVAAATVIALACGTNYVYSAWAPQFAQRMKLSSTESNLIGITGNLGMYLSGVPIGMIIDRKGPRWGVVIGVVCLAGGYYPIHLAYIAGAGSIGVGLLCCFSYLTGAGSAAAFSASLKVCALNFPESRGTATAFPLAAFGLSAFFFSTICAFAFGNNIEIFLLMLATGTSSLTFVSSFFLKVIQPPAYSSLPTHEPRDFPDSQVLHRTKSTEERSRRKSDAIGAPPTHISSSHDPEEDLKDDAKVASRTNQASADTETSSLLSKSSTSDPGEISHSMRSNELHDSPHVDVRGFALLPHPEFWQLFLMMGLLTGIGLMTINNIGNDVQALWRHYDDSASPSFIQKRQSMHVSILSFCSFCGRLLSGIGSDILVKKMNRSRFWCVFLSASGFVVAQLVALQVENPHYLGLVSGFSGLAYGILFGVYPTLVAHTFGVKGLSQNWGTMTLAPIISGNIFNILYGKIYDSHSIIDSDGKRECLDGLFCYRGAYWVTFFAGIAGVAICLWSVWHENEVHKRGERIKRRQSHERDA